VSYSIERIESGPAWSDKASADYGGYEPSQEDAIRAAYGAACKKADANALCPWAPTTTDWMRAGSAPRDAAGTLPQRQQTLAEVMHSTMDTARHAFEAESMQLLLNVAYGSDLVNQPALARNLLERMAAHYAWVTS